MRGRVPLPHLRSMRALATVALLGSAAVTADARSTAQPEQASAHVTLTEGAVYRARLSLSFFQCFASEERIAKKLSGAGFAGVRVFMSSRELPRDWPARYRSRAGGCERYAEGTWARPTTPRKRPSSIDAWWQVTPPS